jgi:hypothetical protein
MSKKELTVLPSNVGDKDEMDGEEYDDMELLERLETVREDMEDLGVTSLAEVIQRIEEMHKQLDSK